MAEATLLPMAEREFVHLLQFSLIDLGDDELGNALSVFDGDGFLAVVNHENADFLL